MVDPADKRLAVVLVCEGVLEDRSGLVAAVAVRFGLIGLFCLTQLSAAKVPLQLGGRVTLVAFTSHFLGLEKRNIF